MIYALFRGYFNHFERDVVGENHGSFSQFIVHFRELCLFGVGIGTGIDGGSECSLDPGADGTTPPDPGSPMERLRILPEP